MGSVGKYSFINAKVRAMRSLLLTPSIYRSMVSASNITDFFSILSHTRFKDLVQEMKSRRSDEIETALLRQEIRQIQLIRKHSHKSIEKLIRLFLERYDGEKLKVLLRYWHRRIQAEPSVIREKIVYNMPVDDILSADTLGEIVTHLEGSPFQKVLSPLVDEFRSGRTLFPLELAIDREHFSRLWKAVEALPNTDRQIARRLLGLEVDLKNIDWLVRYRRYYDLSSTEMIRYTLPHGFRIQQEDMDLIASGKSDLRSVLKTTAGMDIPQGMVVENGIELEDLEHLLYTILLLEARKAFGRFPFSIGSILGYMILLRIETRNIRLLIQAIRYEFLPEKIESRLVL